jgi:hypothetical protein
MYPAKRKMTRKVTRSAKAGESVGYSPKAERHIGWLIGGRLDCGRERSW